jgi:hypothetical protein
MAWSRSIMLLVAAVACVRSKQEPCGNFVCPDTLACVNETCIDRHLLAACNGLSSGATCEVQDQGSGTCDSLGVCNVGYCGDGKIEGDKECDGNNLDGKTCLDFGGTAAGGLTCTSTCTFDKSGCSDVCGDGMVDGNKQCDGTNFGGKTCQDFGYFGGTLLCTGTCTLNFANCMGRCGDGVVPEGFKQCDGSNFGGQTCVGLGYLGSAVAPLTCGSDCAFAPGSCTCGGDYCGSGQQCVGGPGGIGMCQ